MSYNNYQKSSSSRSYSFNSRPTRNFKRKIVKDNINPARFISPAKTVEPVVFVPENKFEDFEVSQTIKDNIVQKGFTTLSPIQDQAIPVGLAGQDVIGIANTGTGKTVAFAIPVINKLIKNKASNALIIAPTRELALQISLEFRSIGKSTGLSEAILIGGTPIGPQLRSLHSNPKIVIGTPGRIKDHLERSSLNLSSFDTVVIDEVDQMLDMGFINDVTHILSKLATPRQSFFFTATMDEKVKTLINTFSHDPVTISVKTGSTVDTVEQNIIKYESKGQKTDKLHTLLIDPTVKKALVFDDTQRSVERLSNELQIRGFSVDSIHGGKSQGQRKRALSRFRENEINILVATDVAARGIDISDISHVINFSTPKTYDDYVHRIGRAGRAGRTGFALTFIES